MLGASSMMDAGRLSGSEVVEEWYDLKDGDVLPEYERLSCVESNATDFLAMGGLGFCSAGWHFARRETAACGAECCEMKVAASSIKSPMGSKSSSLFAEV